MSANVYTSMANAVVYTDKVRLATGSTAVTYNVWIDYPVAATGNLFSQATQIPADSTRDVYVGVSNRMTVSGSNFTVTEIGTQSSGSAAVR